MAKCWCLFDSCRGERRRLRRVGIRPRVLCIGDRDDERIHAVCRQLLEEDNQFSALLAFDMERRPVGVMTLTEAVAIYAEGRLGIIMELYLSLMHSCRCRRSTPCWYLLLLYHYKTNNHTYTRHSH